MEPVFESQTKTKLGSTEMGGDLPTVRTYINDFVGTQCWSNAQNLTYDTLVALCEEGLITDKVQKEEELSLYATWQLPMYSIDFKRIEVSLDELLTERDSNFWGGI